MSHLTEIMATIRADQIFRAFEAVAYDSFDETLEVTATMQVEMVWPVLQRKLVEHGFTETRYSPAPQVVRQFLIQTSNPNRVANKQRAVAELCAQIERKLAVAIAKDPTKPHCIKYLSVSRKLRTEVIQHFRLKGWQLLFDFQAGASRIWLTRDVTWTERDPE